MAKASDIIKQAQAWLGRKESDGSFKEIIDVYNSHKPYARGYKMKYTDHWCSAFVTAVAIKCNATDIIPKECGCEPQINLFKNMGCWQENEAVTPQPGWIIFYDWQDNGVGDNKGYSDHVGIVEKVENGKITIIEGNCSNMVKRTTYAVNAKFIRGYGIPKYDAETATSTPAPAPAPRTYLMKGDKGNEVKEMQSDLIYIGYSCGTAGADGDFGDKTDAALRKFQGDYKLTVDGKYGNQSKTKLKALVAEKKAAASKPAAPTSNVIGTAVAKTSMNVRDAANTSGKIVGGVSNGRKVEVLEALSNGWYKIVWSKASCGYAYVSNASNKYFTYTANNSTASSASTPAPAPVATTIKAGTKFALNNTPVYTSESGATVGKRTGTWYAWEDEKSGQKRIRMTNRLDRVGVKGQVSFFVDVASLK